VPAGGRDDDGAYTEGSIHAMADERLVQMTRSAKRFAKSLDAETNGDDGDDGEP
jgi:hypothetical protein